MDQCSLWINRLRRERGIWCVPKVQICMAYGFIYVHVLNI